MSTKARTFVEKTKLNEAEKEAFAVACCAARTTRGRKLRELSSEWAARENFRRSRTQKEGPTYARNPALFAPGRTTFAAPQFRIQV